MCCPFCYRGAPERLRLEGQPPPEDLGCPLCGVEEETCECVAGMSGSDDDFDMGRKRDRLKRTARALIKGIRSIKIRKCPRGPPGPDGGQHGSSKV